MPATSGEKRAVLKAFSRDYTREVHKGAGFRAVGDPGSRKLLPHPGSAPGAASSADSSTTTTDRQGG
jgi:hypothetical protein